MSYGMGMGMVRGHARPLHPFRRRRRSATAPFICRPRAVPASPLAWNDNVLTRASVVFVAQGMGGMGMGGMGMGGMGMRGGMVRRSPRTAPPNKGREARGL